MNTYIIFSANYKVGSVSDEINELKHNIANYVGTRFIKDNETGAEYIIDMGVNEPSVDSEDANSEFEFSNMDMNESKIYEVVLEYDSHVGYTDKYQKKSAMTTPSMKEPGKNVNDWDAGTPKGSEKPYVGTKGDMAPFTEEEVVEETVEE